MANKKPFLFYAEHMYTGTILPYDVVAKRRGPFPEHEYKVLVLELDPQYSLDILAHSNVLKKCNTIAEAEAFIEENYEKTGVYPSEGEYKARAKAGAKTTSSSYEPPKVGPYDPKKD